MNTNFDFFDPSWINSMDADRMQENGDDWLDDWLQPSSSSSSSASSAAQPPPPPTSQPSTFSQPPDTEPQQALDGFSTFIQSLCTTVSYEERKKLLSEKGDQIPADLQYAVNLNLLAMFFGDRVISSSRLEGYSPLYNVEFMIHILSSPSLAHVWSFDKEPLLQKLRQLKTTTQELEGIRTEKQALAFTTKLKSQLSSLQPGECFLFPGGWKGHPGHFILYEITATDKGFDFRLYNTGAGTTNFHTHKLVNQKTYVNPTLSVLNIAKERLCSEHVLQYMVALRTKSYNGVNELNEKDIYQKLLFSLEGQFYSDENACVVLPQQAGTCSLKALMAYLKNQSGINIQECLYTCQFWCLANFLRNKTQPENSAEKRIIEKAVHGLANRTRKIYFSRLETLTQSKTAIEMNEIDRMLEVLILCEKGIKIAQQFKPALAYHPVVPYCEPVSHHSLSELDGKLNIKSTQVANPGIIVIEQAQDAPLAENHQLLFWRTPVFDPQNILAFFQAYSTHATEILNQAPKKRGEFPNRVLTLAFYQLEKDLLALPSPFKIDFSHLTSEQKKNAFKCLYHLAKNYAKLSLVLSDNLIVCANIWYLFFLLSQLIQEELALETYGIRFPLIEELELNRAGSLQQAAIQNLSLQVRLKDLVDYADHLNAGKNQWHFDTIKKSFQVTHETYESSSDLCFIKQKLQENSEEEESSLLEAILTHYTQRPKKGAVLSVQYYEFREIYFASLLSHSSQHAITPCIIFQKNYPHYEIEFRKNKSVKHPEELHFSHLQSSLFFSSKYNLVRDSHPQNQVRSFAKQQLYSLDDPQFSLISKHELNRISDIQEAKQNKFSLGLNVYKESPHYLEKHIHRECLKGLFYDLFSLQQMIKSYPAIITDLYLFFKTGLEFYKITDPNHHEAIFLLYELGWQTWTLTQDANLLSVLKNKVIGHYTDVGDQFFQSKYTRVLTISVTPLRNKTDLAHFVLLFLAPADHLSDQEIREVLSIQVSYEIGWDKKTFPLLNKLNEILTDPARCNSLFNHTQAITDNLTSKQHNWTKEHFLFHCPEGSFDLTTGKLCIFLDRSLRKAQSCLVEDLGNITGKDLSTFFFKDPYWTDPQETIRIIPLERETQIQRRFQDKWYQYHFYTDGLDDSLFHSVPVDIRQKMQGRLVDYQATWLRTDSLRWYQSLDSSALLLGTDREGNTLYQLEKIPNGNWTIRNAKGLLKAAEDPSFLPPSLSLLTHFTLPQNVSCWVNEMTEQVVKVDVHHPLPLSIKKNPSNEWVIKEYEEYIISDDHSLCPFRSLPPYFHVVNTEGKCFALIPTFLLKVKEKGSASDPFYLKHIYADHSIDKVHHMYVYGNKECKERFYLYEYDHLSGELIAKDTLSRLYLAYLYFADQQYEQAHQLLKKCQQTYPYSKEELLFFQNFFSCRQENSVLVDTPEQNALLVMIASQVVEAFQFKDAMALRKEKEEKSPILSFYNICDRVENYIHLIDTLPCAFRLSPQKELSLLNHLLTNRKEGSSWWIHRMGKEELPIIQKRLSFLREKKELTGPTMSIFLHIAANYVTSSLTLPFSDIDKRFDYKTVLQDIAALTWDCLRSKYKATDFTSSFVMAIWMGCLSDDPEENAMAVSKIVFFKVNKGKNQTEGKRLVSLQEFLMTIFYTKASFKQYLLNQDESAYVDADKILAHWPVFIELLKTQKKVNPHDHIDDHLIIDDWKTPITRTAVSNMSYPSYSLKPLGYLSSTEKRSLLTTCEQTVEDCIQKLKNKRQQIVKAFFTFKQAEEKPDFIHVDVESKAQQRLDSQPIAQALYKDFLEEHTACLIHWSFNESENPLEGFEALSQQIKAQKAALQADYASLEKTLVAKANATALEREGDLTVAELQTALKRRINIFSHQIQAITLEEMALMLLEGRWDQLLQRNIRLSPQDSEYLKAQMIQFMLLKTEYDVYAKADDYLDNWIVKKEKQEGLERAYCVQQTAEALSVERHYSLLDQPNFLAFEYLTHLILRKHQVDKINQTLSFNPSHQILKLMMGEGKTDIILPFLSKMLANGVSFPVIVAPASLYEEYVKNLKNRSEQRLSQKVFKLQFDRSSSTELSCLATLNDMLEDLIKERGVLVTTAESLKALILKYEELLVAEEEVLESSGGSANQNLTNRRQALGHILQKFLKSSVSLIDEGHLALKSLMEMNFTLSNYEGLKEAESQVVLKIYKALKEIGFNLSIPLEIDLSEDEFSQFDAFKEQLISHLYPSKKEKGIREYLNGKDPEFIYVLEQADADLAREIALVKDQLTSFLPFTLSKALNHAYGRHKNNPDIEYAIPYIGSQKPSPSSEFGHKHVVFNFTVQMLLQEGLLERQFADWVKKLKSEALKKQVHLSEAAADAFIRQFLDDVSIKNKNLDDEHIIKQLCQAYGKKDVIIFHYLQTIVRPGLKFYCEKLSANGEDLGNFISPNVLVITATPYNEKALSQPFHKQVTPAELSAEEKKMRYALSLPANQKIYIAKEESHRQALALIKDFDRKEQHTNLAAFIDLGAYFKDITSFEAAQLILASLPRIEGVLFFEDKSNQLVCLRRGKREAEAYIPGRIPLHQLFAFYDNVHTFAAHIDLHPHAKAIVSLNQDTEKYALEQAIKRMRKETQTFAYLISSSLEERLKDLTSQDYVDVETLFLHGIFKQAAMLEKEIILSTMHQLKHLVKKNYLIRQLNQAEPLKMARKVLVDKLDFSPSFDFKQKVDPRMFFLRYYQNAISDTSIGNLDYHTIISRAVSLLPPLIDENHSGGQNQEVQRQEEKKVEQLINRSSGFAPKQEEIWLPDCLLNIESSIYSIPTTFHGGYNGLLTCYHLNEFLSQLEGKALSLINPGILMTRNFAKTSELHFPNWEIPIKPVDYFVQLYYPQEDAILYLIVSLNEASALKIFIKAGFLNDLPSKPSITLFSIQGKYVAGDQVEVFSPLALAQMKFFDGREFLSEGEERAAMSWVQGNEDLLIDLFAKLHRNRETQQDYGSGNLFKMIMQSKNLQRQRVASHVQSSTVTRKRPREEEVVQEEEEEDFMQVDTEPVFKKQKT